MFLEAALELLEQGWWVVPIHADKKHPAAEWGDIYDAGKFPSEDDLLKWWQLWPDAHVGIITGKLSGVLVVDCDNEEALAYAEQVGLTRTPWVVQTKRGKHFYFKWPEGVDHIKTLTWQNADGLEWPKNEVKGLDRKAHKGVVLVPPTPNYKSLVQLDWDDVPVYEHKNYGKPKPSNVIDFNDFKFENLSLAHIRVKREPIEETRDEVARLGRKLMAGVGDGRHQRLVTLAGYYAAKGKTYDETYALMKEYMLEFFDCPHDVDEKEFVSTIDHAFKHEGAKEPMVEAEEKKDRFKPLLTSDADRLMEEASGQTFFIDPIIPQAGTIMQVHGYSGHGKSMFVRHMLYAAAAGQESFGPYDIHKKPRVLYLDFENSRANLSAFMTRSRQSFGNAGGNFMVWTPFIDDMMMNLRTEGGVKNLEGWIKANRPDIVVFDTIRSAWVGLPENSAEEWGKINELALLLRNNGVSVIFIHHSNKPTDGRSREAGSTNQLTVLETQLKVTQVFADQETADVRAGLYDGDLTQQPMVTLDTPPARRLDERLQVCMELRYGKVREWSDTHEPFHYVGFVESSADQKVRVICQRTPKQRAITLAQPWEDASGTMRPPLSDMEIADRVNKPVAVVSEWVRHLRGYDIASKISNEKANTVGG